MSEIVRRRRDYWTDLKDLLCLNIHSRTLYGFPIRVSPSRHQDMAYGCTIHRESYDIQIGVMSGCPRKVDQPVVLARVGGGIDRIIKLKSGVLLSRTILAGYPDLIYAFFIGGDDAGMSSLPYLELRKPNRKEALIACRDDGEEVGNPIWSPAPLLINLKNSVNLLPSKTFRAEFGKVSEKLSISLDFSS